MNELEERRGPRKAEMKIKNKREHEMGGRRAENEI